MTTEAQARAYAAFLDWSRRSGWTQARLADEVVTNRAHLNQVLTGARTGGHTWRRLVRVLPMDGLLLLQQCAAWNSFAERALAARLEREKFVAIGARCRAATAAAEVSA